MNDDKQNNDLGQNQDTPEWNCLAPQDPDFNQANIPQNDMLKNSLLRTSLLNKIYDGEIRGKYVIYLSIFGVVFVVFSMIWLVLRGRVISF